MVDVILQIKTDLMQASVEGLKMFGKGGYSQEQFDIWQKDGTMPKDLNFLGYVCTGITADVKGNKYTTVRIDDYFLEPLEQMGETPNARFIQEYTVDVTEVDYTVEVPVYDDLGEQVDTEVEVRTKTVRTPTFSIEVNDYNIDGEVIGTRMQPVGGIA